MRVPFVSRAAYDAVCADRDRLRQRAETAEQHTATAVYNRKQTLRQNAELDAANRRLANRNLELGRRLAVLTEADPAYAASLEQRVTRLTKAVGRYLAELWAARLAASHAQAEVERLRVRLKASEERARQAVQGLRPDEWESRPVDGAPRVRREAPGEELRRAWDHCRALEERLAQAEGRPKGVAL